MPPSLCTLPILRAAAWSPEDLPGPPPAEWVNHVTGPPDLATVDPLLRRRLSPLGKGMVACAARVAEGRGPLRAVFASQHGDPARTLPVLEDLAQGLEASPTQFSMNVHNAIAGIWSIARRDPSPSISLAGGPETFGWGLVEAWSQLQEEPGSPVLFVFGDDLLPELLRPFEPRPAPLHALALLLGSPATRRLEVKRDPDAQGKASTQALSLHALLGISGTWHGERGAWSFEVRP